MSKNKLIYELNADSKIVYLQLIGEISSSNIISLNKQVINDPKFDSCYNWVVDLRKSKQLFSHDSMNPFLSFFKKNAEVFRNTKMACVICNPKQSATIDNLENLFNDLNINVSLKKVIDKDLAYNWILS